MKIEDLKNQCTGCSACMAVCPKQCIIMELDNPLCQNSCHGALLKV
jgi:NAD-dependent dihydropyrimidine dehydrogenase PreA subunit